MNWLAALKTSANLDPAIQSAIRMDMAKFDRFMLALILFHAPFALFVIPFGYGTWIIGAIGSAIACTGALLAYFLARGTLLSRFAMANLLAVYSATFILQQFGRIEMHFHVFGSIAFLAIYRDWRVLLSPAPLVVVYHTVLNYCQVYNVEFLGFPLLIFNYGVGLDIVLVHAGFVVFETSVLVYYAAEFHARFVSEMQARLTIERRGQQVAARAEEIGSEIVNSSGELHSSSEELSSVATDQSASIEEMSASFEEISAGLDQLSATAQEQRAKLDNVNEKQKTLATLASAVKLQLDSVRKDSQEVQAEADRAGEALQLIIQSMRSIDSNSGQVRNIVAVINEIADRVNLLSLNASIEAARAGEYGRGFSVVAQEISRLADRTAESVNEINSLIDRNGLEVAAGRTKVSEGARVIGQLVERIKLVGDNLSELNNSLKRQESEFVHLGEEIVQMTEGVGRTLSSLGEQAETGRHIQDAMQGLATMSQRLVASAVELNRIMQSNRQQATELSDAVKALAGAG